MIRSLKNDVVALEYPINYFMSQCIHNGEIPYWFNTWAMGFPLQSNLTWGIYSTPQMLFCSVFNYNIYTLHIEFMFFVLMSGWGMYHLLKKYILKEENISVILACCYMLSGFITGSGQWMLYISAAAFIPFVLSSLLRLLQSPSFRNAFLFASLYFIMFTSVYAAFNIITTYCLFVFTIGYIWINKQERQSKILQIRYAILAGAMTILLCLPCLLSTLELLKYMSRGQSIDVNSHFFNSNYLHPYGLGTLLFPFSSVKMSFPNTEGTMLNTYMGLFTLLLLPVAILKTIKEKKRLAFIFLLAAVLFLFISFGKLLPFRDALNIFPGFSYFRNPSIFRFYFIFFIIIFLGRTFRNASLENVFDLNNISYSRAIKLSFFIFSWLCVAVLVFYFNAGKRISPTSISQIIKNISFSQSIFIISIIQLILLGAIFYSVLRKRYQLIKLLFTADLIINTLLCTPYFVVSSYSLPQVNHILHSEIGFPLQSEKINKVTTTYIDAKMNVWNNANIFHKQVSANESYRGPLVLNNFSHYADDSAAARDAFNHPVIFLENDTVTNNSKLKLIIQYPTHIRSQVNPTNSTTVTVMQNYFPGWRAYYNNKPLEFIDSDKPGLTTAVPKGKGRIDFVYSKKEVWIIALLTHFITISFMLFYFYKKIRSILFIDNTLFIQPGK